ncbi:hypothetical protein PIB30_035446 [Stylosanthes scabra]|uniref:Uncharacterized protein n=1 Tax=Stylosanthes scabra TaxID=79078 RepID=A0ABU6TF00_9FABA|nr:hypothetical protein [Stylosanthes scabra]
MEILEEGQREELKPTQLSLPLSLKDVAIKLLALLRLLLMLYYALPLFSVCSLLQSHVLHRERPKRQRRRALLHRVLDSAALGEVPRCHEYRSHGYRRLRFFGAS